MGFALAQAAAEAGAITTLVSGPVALDTPPRVSRVDVTSALEMAEQSLALAADCDIFIACAAVADYRPATVQTQKIKKAGEQMSIELVRNPDIVASVAALEPHPFTVGFAAETSDLVSYARGKLRNKGLDLVVANDVADQQIGFNSEENAVTLVWSTGEKVLPQASKGSIARQIIDQIAAMHPAIPRN
jgi:phosphopantothenoylcysteine decarboxylase/phosphopantothenate--cysteine ligase